jgi:hypothetical protein
MVDPEEQALWRPWLLPSERLLWSGRPARGLVLGRHDLLLIPFSLLWGGFAIFWNVLVWAGGAPLFFSLWGLPFLAVGLYLIIGRFFHDAAIRAATLYGVTDRRLLILRTRWGRGLRSQEIGSVAALDMQEYAGGRGTLTFEPAPSSPFASARAGEWVPAASRIFRFYRIEQPRLVHERVSKEIEGRRRELAAATADAALYPPR